MDYLDIEIEVSTGERGGYVVKVLHSPVGEASSTMRMPFTGLALQNNLQALQIALLRSGGTRRGADMAESKTVQEFGERLWKALFNGDILGRYEATRAEARRQDAGVRIKLRFDTPKLAALPWEYLFDPGRGDYVALSERTPVVRYIPLPEAVEPLEVQPPLRILGVMASPSDLPDLNLDRERQRLDMALADLIVSGLVEMTWMPAGTTRELLRTLHKGPWHVFHFVGHGGFDEGRGEGVVIFLDEAGKSQRVSATDLGHLLGDHDPLRLAVLNACESARGDQVDVFSSTAATLVRRGTPAVIAMQYEITDDAAIEFSRSFYEAVGSGMPVDSALAAARKGVALANDGTLEWGTPVLYTRAPDGVLFDIGAMPAAAAVAARPAEAPAAPPAAAPPAAEPPPAEPPAAPPPAATPPPTPAAEPAPAETPSAPPAAPPFAPPPPFAQGSPPAQVSSPPMADDVSATYVSTIGANLGLSCGGNAAAVQCGGMTPTGASVRLEWMAAGSGNPRRLAFQWDRYDPMVANAVVFVVRSVLGEPLGTQAVMWISAIPNNADISAMFGPYQLHVTFPNWMSVGQLTITG